MKRNLEEASSLSSEKSGGDGGAVLGEGCQGGVVGPEASNSLAHLRGGDGVHANAMVIPTANLLQGPTLYKTKISIHMLHFYYIILLFIVLDFSLHPLIMAKENKCVLSHTNYCFLKSISGFTSVCSKHT